MAYIVTSHNRFADCQMAQGEIYMTLEAATKTANDLNKAAPYMQCIVYEIVRIQRLLEEG